MFHGVVEAKLVCNTKLSRFHCFKVTFVHVHIHVGRYAKVCTVDSCIRMLPIKCVYISNTKIILNAIEHMFNTVYMYKYMQTQ